MGNVLCENLKMERILGLVFNSVWISGGGTPTKRREFTWRREQSVEDAGFEQKLTFYRRHNFF